MEILGNFGGKSIEAGRRILNSSIVKKSPADASRAPNCIRAQT